MRMCRSSMLRPSLNHGTLHNDDDGDDYKNVEGTRECTRMSFRRSGVGAPQDITYYIRDEVGHWYTERYVLWLVRPNATGTLHVNE